MSKLATDVTDPLGIVGIEILYKIMDYPFLLALLISLPFTKHGYTACISS